MKGIRLTVEALGRRPLGTLAALGRDYLVWIGMVGFVVLLVVTRWPLAALDRVAGSRLRARMVDLVARLAHG